MRSILHPRRAAAVYPTNSSEAMSEIKSGFILRKIVLIIVAGVILATFFSMPAAAGSLYSTIGRLYLPDFGRYEDSNLDLFIDEENRLYILNLKADQLYILDNQGLPPKKATTAEGFYSTANTAHYNQLTKVKLHLPASFTDKKAGFWVEDGRIYLKPSADYLVWVYNLRGELLKRIELKVPGDSYLLFTDIAVDPRGYIYLLESNSHQIEVFDSEGNFCGTFTKSGSRENQLPGSPQSIFIDKEGSIYCLVSLPGKSGSQIVKYSYQGRKIITFPEVPEEHYVNIYVDQHQNTFAVNPERSLVEKFDRRGRSICKFEAGCLSGLAVDNRGLVYLDCGKNVFINLMCPATVIQWIELGNAALLDELWDEAEKCFLKAKVLDNQADYIHLALGEVYYQQRRWIKAMNEFKFIKDNWRYSQTLTRFRNNLIINDWPLIVTGLLAVGLFMGMFIAFLRRFPFGRRLSLAGIIWRPANTLKTQIRTMNPFTTLTLILLFPPVHYFSRLLNNPIFTGERRFFSWPVFERDVLIALGLIFIWTVTAYKVGELFQGLAKYRDLIDGTAICLIPALVCEPILALLSHLLTYDELWIYQWLNGLLVGWMVILFLNKIRVTEDFGWAKSLGVGLVNLAATGLFLVFLGFIVAVNQQMGSFLTEIFKEIYNRLTV